MITERAKWKDCWDEIRFCSDRCKSEGKRVKRQQAQAQEGEAAEVGGSQPASSRAAGDSTSPDA